MQLLEKRFDTDFSSTRSVIVKEEKYSKPKKVNK